MKIVRSPNGVHPRTVELSDVQVPDLWHIARSHDQPTCNVILEAWGLAHDLLWNLKELERKSLENSGH